MRPKKRKPKAKPNPPVIHTGMQSLRRKLDHCIQREPERASEWQKKFDWTVARASQYAEFCNTDVDTILDAWEKKRTYWFVNYYQECNQPDLSKMNVLTLDGWMKEGRERFGPDPLDWKFKCPFCGHVQTMREFRDAGKDPDLAYLNCASRHGLGGKPDCKWTVGGFLKIGGRYVLDSSFCPHLIFDFADQ